MNEKKLHAIAKALNSHFVRSAHVNGCIDEIDNPGGMPKLERRWFRFAVTEDDEGNKVLRMVQRREIFVVATGDNSRLMIPAVELGSIS